MNSPRLEFIVLLPHVGNALPSSLCVCWGSRALQARAGRSSSGRSTWHLRLAPWLLHTAARHEFSCLLAGSGSLLVAETECQNQTSLLPKDIRFGAKPARLFSRGDVQNNYCLGLHSQGSLGSSPSSNYFLLLIRVPPPLFRSKKDVNSESTLRCRCNSCK